MRRKLLFAFTIVLAAFAVYFITNKETATEKARENYAKFLKNHPYNKTLQLTKKERKGQGIPPNKYFEQEYLLEMNPNTGRTHPENVFEVQNQLKANRKLQRVPGDATDNMWVERGPNNVGGRTRVVLFDPNDATHKRVFAGGVSGGLWVNNDITDANTSWTRVGIDENLSITCMTVDPNNSQIMYVGTGESYTGSQAIGNGVWKSIDGGASWTNVFNDNLNSNIRNRLFFINDIVAWNNPSTSKTVVFIGVAGAHTGSSQFPGANINGLYKSLDNGSSWETVTLPTIPGETQGTSKSVYEPDDIEIGIDNTIWVATGINIWGVGGGTILKSTNGSNFSVEHTIFNADRTQISVSGTNKDVLYVLASRDRQSLGPVIEKTTNSFTSVVPITTPADADTGIPNNDFTRGQAGYDLLLAVDPTNDARVYVGGIDLFRSSDSGASWKQISKWSNNNNLAAMIIPTVHADQHGWAFHPTDANKAIIGNDGGVYYASSLSGAETTTNTISSRNKDYNVTQFYHGEIGQNVNQKQLLSGAQDNGSQFINGANAGINSTFEIRGGDGAYSFIDKDGAYAIASYVYSNHRIYNLPYNGTGVEISTDSDPYSGSFINPADLDDNLDILYTNYSKTVAGNRTYKIAKFANLLTSSPVKTELTNDLLTAEPTTFKVSPFTTTSTTLFVGTSDGKLLRITHANTAGPVWSDISSGSFSGSISSIAFGASENEILVTFHNYGVTSIWSSFDAGNTWDNREGNFPDIPVKSIIMNPLDNKEVIIGTQLGVWRTGNFKDANPTWSQSFNGMSNVKVTSFSLRTTDNTVMATTYGRGMFTGQFTAGATASLDDVIKDNKVFTMYPTVSSGEFTVFAKNTVGKATLLMFDINGKSVFSKQVDFTQQEKQPISVSLTSGVYIVNLIDSNNRKATGKVIIK
ncbi:MAG: hypothetical protein ACI8WA_000661 [Polaribacter sp.]|jgi:hypothetical protein